MPRRPALPLLLAALSAGCGHKTGDAPPTPSSSASAARPTASPAAIEAMARAAAACKAYDTGFDSGCPAMKAWSDAKDDFDEGRADPALVGLLAAPDEKLRYVAAYKLNQYGKAFKRDRGMAEGVVSAAEKETTKFAGYEVGAAAGRVSVRETGTFDRVAAMVKKHAVSDVRRGIVSNLLFNNQGDAQAFGVVRDAVKDGDKSVSVAALQSFWTGGTRQGDATCQLYFDNVDNPSDELAAEACNYLAWFGQCAARYDGLLDALERRVKAGTVGSTSYVTAARHVCEDAKATGKQRQRAAAMGRALAGAGAGAGADKKKVVQGWIRSSALETVLKCDATDAGRTFVAKFTKDGDRAVADKATELLAKK